MGRRASGGRWGSIPGVGLCRGRPGSGVRRWADLAGANGSSAIVLGNFSGVGRRGMGQGAAIWDGRGRALLGLENMGVEGVVPRWAELCSPAMVWARAWRPGAPIYRVVHLVAKVWSSWGRSNWPGRGRNAATASHGAGGRGGLPGSRGRVPLARAARGDGQGANRGRSRAVWVGLRRVGGQVAAPAYGVTP